MKSLYSFLLLFFFLLNYISVHSQDKETLLLWDVEKLINEKKYNEAERKLNLLNIRPELRNDIKLYVAYVDLYTNIGDYTLALEYANRCKDLANKSKDALDEAYASYALARLNFKSDVFKNTIQFSNDALLILKNFPEEHMLHVKLYRLLSFVNRRSNSFSDDYKKSMFESLKHAEKTKQPWLILLSKQDISSMYMVANNTKPDIKHRQNITKYIKESLDYLEQNRAQISNINAEIVLNNNYASMINDEPFENYSVKERTTIAESYIKKAINLANQHNLINSFPIVYATYGEILLNKNNKVAAEEYFLKAYEISNHNMTNDDYPFLIFIINELGTMYKDRGDYVKAIDFNQKTIQLLQKYNSIQLEEKNKFLQAYYSTNEKIQKRIAFEKEAIKISRQLNISVFIVVFLGLLIWFLIYKNKAKNLISKQRTELLLSEKTEAELQLQLQTKEKARLKAESELMALQQEQLSKQALATSLQLEQKKTFINELKEKVTSKEEILWDNILKNEKLKDDDFHETRVLFQDIHPNFFKTLTNIAVTKLTALDLKYAAYIYLNLNNQQIATILNVEHASVRTTKYRLKQKLGLGKDEDLTTFINNLNILK